MRNRVWIYIIEPRDVKISNDSMNTIASLHTCPTKESALKQLKKQMDNICYRESDGNLVLHSITVPNVNQDTNEVTQSVDGYRLVDQYLNTIAYYGTVVPIVIRN